MYLLRIGRQRRGSFDRDATSPEDVAEASRDLKLDVGEEGLSVYRVEGQGEILELAVRWALTCRSKPRPMDYVVFPSELATNLGLIVAYMPREYLDPFLNTHHYEIIGLTPELASRLAAAILGYAGRRVERIQEKDLAKLGAELCRRDPELKRSLIGQWATLLGGSVPEE